MPSPPPPPSAVPTPPESAHEVTRLLHAMQGGDAEASEQLVALVYHELHDLASHYMRNEREGHTLQPTALVSEVYLRLVGQQGSPWQGRSHFFGVAAQAMRRILVDHARRRNAAKREGGHRVTLEDSAIADTGSERRALDVLALDAALDKLAVVDARYARVVELRFFAGLEVEEVARLMGTSPATVKRDWTFAKAFLQRELDA